MEKLDKFISRKLLLTIGAVVLVAGCDLLGVPLDEQALDAILKLVLGLVGAQGAVDVAAAFRAGGVAAKMVETASDDRVSSR